MHSMQRDTWRQLLSVTHEPLIHVHSSALRDESPTTGLLDYIKVMCIVLSIRIYGNLGHDHRQKLMSGSNSQPSETRTPTAHYIQCSLLPMISGFRVIYNVHAYTCVFSITIVTVLNAICRQTSQGKL